MWPHHHAKPKSLSVRIAKTVEITRSRDRCWFATIHQFPNKDLIVTMSMHTDSVHPQEGFREAFCVSHDGGETWSQRYPTDGAGGFWAEVPGPHGSVWELKTHGEVTQNNGDFPLGRLELFDSGPSADGSGIKIVQIPGSQLHMSTPTRMVMFTGSILPSKDGGLIGCVYSRTQQAPQFYRLTAVHSEDSGQTWREGTVIATADPGGALLPGSGKDGPCEAGIVRLRDGRLFVIYRTGGDGYMGVAWSSDDGRTWTPPKLIPFKGVEPRVRLLSNGVLACSTGRPGPVTMMFSLDGTGEEWSHETPIFHDMSTRYTEFLELSPGKIFLVYDSVPYGWKAIPATDEKAQNVIYGTYLDVELTS
jgi:hypothetical protein